MYAILDKISSTFIKNPDDDTMLFDSYNDAEKYAYDNCDEYMIIDVI